MAGIGFMSQYVPIMNILIILLKAFGLLTFRVRKDRDRIKGVLKVLDAETRSSSTIFEYGKMRPAGAFVGWKCFGYYADTNGRDDAEGEIMIFTTEAYFKKILDKSATDCNSVTFEHTVAHVPKSKQEISIWARRGSYESLYYSRLKVDLSMISPMGEQVYIVDDIIQRYRAKERLVVFIQGVTGAGKSSVGLLLAKELKGNYCNKFNPTEPGDNFQNMLRDMDIEDDEEKTPLIIVIEEVDKMIKVIHNDLVPIHKKVMTMIRSKSDYNTFFDDMIMFTKVIIILTSNVSKEEIDKLDNSYLRQGRINAYYTMMKPLGEC
jgi:Cdc6-like AAA superfamily ATPase